MKKIAYVFIPCSYNGPCITESGPKVFEYVLKKNNYEGDYFVFNLEWNESLNRYMIRICKELKIIIKKYDKIVVFGGNHLSLLPVYNATSSVHYNTLTLDAHRDYLYNDGMITHGSFLRYVKKNNTKHYLLGYRDNVDKKDLYDFFDKEISSNELKKENNFKFQNIKYIDIDVDVLDKKIFPYTVCAMDNGILIKHLKQIFKNNSIQDVKILSFSKYAYVLDTKKRGLKTIIKIVDDFIDNSTREI